VKYGKFSKDPWRAMPPFATQEQAFLYALKSFKEIGYGRMMQLIQGEWARMLMDSGMDEETARRGAKIDVT